jgi:excinuclease UvrABC nuclease subunit
MAISIDQIAQQILAVLVSTSFDQTVSLSRSMEGLPDRHGIYAVKHQSEGILYIGKTNKLKARFTNGHKAFLWAWLEYYPPETIGIAYVELDFIRALHDKEIEVRILQRMRPRYNTQMRMED